MSANMHKSGAFIYFTKRRGLETTCGFTAERKSPYVSKQIKDIQWAGMAGFQRYIFGFVLHIGR